MGKLRKKAKSQASVSNKTWELRLTMTELEHLRDLFSVRLPIDMQTTVSQSLASATGKPTVEAIMWQQVTKACEAAGVALDRAAPDFVVGLLAAPPMGVFQVAAEALQEHEPALNKVFPDEDDEGQK